MTEDESRDAGAFEFTGTWREFAPIAFTNLLLTIVTLGIYRFWATTRERRYLWSRTRFIDERLEWTGTGLELFVGFVLVFALLLAPLLFLQFGLQAMILRNQAALAGLLAIVSYVAILYLIGVAVFRALRYRLSRTYWHGIRGGSDDQGWLYGVVQLGFTFASIMTLGLLVPLSMTTRWNFRWNAMSFGPHRFEAAARARPLMKRFLLFYLLPLLGLLLGIVAFAMGVFSRGGAGAAEGAGAIVAAILGIVVIAIYPSIAVIALLYYAAYYRQAVGALRLGELSFSFEARTWDWVKLILGHIGLVIVTLGIGLIFIGYRNWRFAIRHLRAYGDVDLTTFTQSATRAPGQGEGLLDAFDIGAV